MNRTESKLGCKTGYTIIHKVLLGLVLGLLIFISLPEQASMEETSSNISFPDKQLEQALKEILKLSEQEAVTQQSLESLKVVDLSNKGITNVEGLQYASNITHLNLSRNKIADIEPLSTMIKLRSLDLSVNEITSIEALANMKDMGRLKVNWNKLTSIDTVKHFNRLHTFEAGDNQITDIQALASLTDLNWLKLGLNQISNIQPLKKLTKIQNLDISNNKIKDISALQPLTKTLSGLHIEGNQISDIQVLKDMTSLYILYAGNNQIKNIDALEKLTNLAIVDLSQNLIYDLEPLRDLKGISVLYLASNRIWNIEPLSNHRFDTHYDTGALRYGLTLDDNYLDLRSTTKSYRLLNKLAGSGGTYNQHKAQRLIIGSRTAYVGEASFALSAAPFIEKGRTYVPIRFISERLGAKVSWSQSKKEVTIRKDDTTIQWKVNEKKAMVNGKSVTFDAPILLKSNSSFIPVRLVSELLESSVEYMSSPKTVIIFEKKQYPRYY